MDIALPPDEAAIVEELGKLVEQSSLFAASSVQVGSATCGLRWCGFRGDMPAVVCRPMLPVQKSSQGRRQT